MLKAYRPVKVVAFDLGFKQVSHFSREFKRYHGLSPKAFLDHSAQKVASLKINGAKENLPKRI